MGRVAELAKELAEKTKEGLDLRYIHGSWCVMVPFGNIMTVVHGTVSDSPEDALQKALDCWDTRSPDRPFKLGYTND